MQKHDEQQIFEKTIDDKSNPEIERKRKILLILISLLLILCSANFTYVALCVSKAAKTLDEHHPPNNSGQILSVIISMIYYLFGFFVTYRRYQTGLIVFAWLGFAALLLILAMLIIALSGILILTARSAFITRFSVGSTLVISCLVASSLQIITVRYALILRNLLKQITYPSVEHI